MPNPSKRMTANPARPARYRPGKAVPEESSDEDEDESENETPPPKAAPQPKATSFPGRGQPGQTAAKAPPGEYSDDEEGFVTEDESDEEPSKARTTASTSTAKVVGPAGKVEPPENLSLPAEDGESEESEGSEEDSSEEDESSSEDEAPRAKFQRPTFIKKSDRSVQNSKGRPLDDVTESVPVMDSRLGAEDEARRKQMADLMIKDKLERDAAAQAAGRKAWDDEEEIAPEDMVDDTDGLEPEAEYAAWKLRELKRLKRDREAIEEREKEIEEIERRRNLTQEEREAEDRDFITQQKEERDANRGEAGFMQKYHHKGAFFQDDETAELLRKRDLMSTKTVDEVKNREALPQYMQIRDMTKLGRKGRTRYKDLKNEDTGRWGEGFENRDRKGPKTGFGLDERFQPDRAEFGKVSTGANSSALGERNGGERRRYGEEGDDRARRRSRSPKRKRSRSRSHSRSPRRYSRRDSDYHGEGRRRSPSPSRDYDKRRRVEVT